jgi:hypothetical protein
VKVVVFLGPTLDLATARSHLDATFLPPVAHGDFIRVAAERPKAIGIIDGYFDHTPAVWHKEVLWAIAHRIPVFGAASIGALRACELGPFGMIGVGEIFRAFQQGELEDDDEVAVAHLSGERGFETVSEALVNIRCTMKLAVSSGAASASFAEQLVSIAKNLHYTDRSWERVLAGCTEYGTSRETVDTFAHWLNTGRVDQKRLDAIALLSVMSRLLSNGWRPDPPDFRFNNTNAWQAAVLRLIRAAAPESPRNGE